MKILAIETSCDDTGIAVLEIKSGRFKVLSNIVASQIEVHKQYGGVFPMMAKREHLKNLPIALENSLKEAKILNPKKEINFIAVTNGPGLEPCLWTGVNFAKELSKLWNIPVVPVNHIESHILVNLLQTKNYKPQTNLFPAIALIVSGGHTQLILVRNIKKYKILGETRDDAAGECFDKCAKILGLEYPGGPIISKLAEGIVPQNILPRPMIHTKDYDFSFSGLKTAVLYKVKKDSTVDQSVVLSKKYKAKMAAEVQQAIIDVLLKKTIQAIKDYKAKTLILGGGVSANQELRRQFKLALSEAKYGSTAVEPYFLCPPADLSTDNAVMIAVAGYFNRNKKVAPGKVATIKANANLRI